MAIVEPTLTAQFKQNTLETLLLMRAAVECHTLVCATLLYGMTTKNKHERILLFSQETGFRRPSRMFLPA